MKVSVTTDMGEVVTIELAKDADVSTFKAAIEAETRLPAAQQSLFFSGQEMANDAASLQSVGVQEYDVVLLRRKAGAAATAAGQPQARQQLQRSLGFPQALGTGLTPDLLRQLTQNPGMLEELQQSNPALAQQVIGLLQQQMAGAPVATTIEDEFDMETQRRLEEEIRTENVNRQLSNAMEFAPEVFGQVFMLYINCEVNGQKVKAFVDSGAQMTIMNPAFAEKCGLSNFIDKRWTGTATGVGSAKILGRVHMAQLKIESMFLPVSFTIIEGQSIDLLLGLDMLKRHQCILDFQANVLRIGTVATPFLGESELPAKDKLVPEEQSKTASLSSSAASPQKRPVDAEHPTTAPPAVRSTAPAQAQSQQQPSLQLPQLQLPPQFQLPQLQLPQAAAVPARAPAGVASATPAQPSAFPEAMIKTLMDLGATRAQAIGALQAAGGNPDLAASLLF